MPKVQDASVRDASGIDWEAVYQAEAAKLWRALVLQTGNGEIASDAVAEAFAQAISRGEALKKPGAWVWRAAFMIARGEQGSMRTVPLSEHVAAVTEPEQVVDLVRALAGLSPLQRASTVLHYFAGYSMSETAAILGSTRSAVGVHLFRARGKLRDELGDVDDL